MTNTTLTKPDKKIKERRELGLLYISIDVSKNKLERIETKRYQDLISAQTERLTFIKNQIDLELQKKHLKTND